MQAAERALPGDTKISCMLLDEGVRDKVCPGAVWAVGDTTGVRTQGTTGVLDPDEPDIPKRSDTVFGAAGLTKILAVWSST